jgi:ABC-2 type transport system ATP-binding protein
MSEPAIVNVRAVSKDYGARRVVDNVTFDLHRGEILGLLGPNGSGKSTIIKILAGYLAPTIGSVAISGFDHISDSAAARRCLGYVPEDVNLYPQMQVIEFLRFMAGLKGLRGGGLRAGVARVIDELDLASVVRQALGRLSHGYRQRVAIAQALVNRPPLVIFDEPTNGLDPHQIIEVRELIKRLAPAQTVLITSHVLSEIERIATRVAILVSGKLLTANVTISATPQLMVRIDGPRMDVAAAMFASVADVTAVRECAVDARPGRGYELSLASPAAVAAVAPVVTAAGYTLLELREHRQDLEAAFLALTSPAH